MANRSTATVLALGAWLTASLLGACNSVLGIEDAQPRASSSSKPLSSLGYYTGSDSCESDNSTCTQCVAENCSATDLGTCLGDADCRTALDSYNSCLGSSCNANASGDCSEALLGMGQNFPLLTCVVNQCAAQCAATPVESPCQLYCACMGANCAGKFMNTSTAMGDCMTNCQALEQQSPDLVTCRRTHCEISKAFPAGQHCNHAVGVDFCGTAAAVQRTDQCNDKSLVGFACNTDADCCSGICGIPTSMICGAK